MKKKIVIELPQTGLSFYATLLEDDEPELCEKLWEKLEQPQKLFCRHPVSTGEEFSGEGRPPIDPVKTGTQVSPLGRRTWLMSKIKPGSIGYSLYGGYGGLTVYYGKCTEPIAAKGAIVGKVDEADMGDCVKAGEAVWRAQYLTHTPMFMIAGRKE